LKKGTLVNNEQGKKSNSKAPLKFEYISEDERRLENIAREQKDTIFNKWVKEKYKIEKYFIFFKYKNSYNYLAMN
jgi:hypothetical protein